MFHRRYQLYSNLLMTADTATGFLALYVSYNIRYHLIQFAPYELSRFFNSKLLPLSEYFLYFLVLSPFWIVFLMLTQRYSGLMRHPLRQQVFRVSQFLLAMGILMGFLTFVFKLEISRPVLFILLIVSCSMLVFNRVVLHWILSRNTNEQNQVRIVIVGTDKRAQQVGSLLESYAMWGCRVVGYLKTEEENTSVPGSMILGSARQLPQLLQGEVIADEIIFLASHSRDLVELEEDLLLCCEDLGIRTRLVADFFPTSISRVSLEFLEDLPLLTFSTAPDHTLGVMGKRVVDLVLATVLLVGLFPLMLFTAILIKWTTSGPVLYRQVRCGLYGRKFKLIKFRTMIDGAEDKLWEIIHLNEMDGPVFKMRKDPRVTGVGQYLRKSSIDELPQLWNVIKGEMSLVGPRAPLPDEVQHYVIKQRRRLSVKPGITCLWQISGRSNVNFQRWMELDLEYIDNWSFWLDIQIMLKTIPAVFIGRGAH